MAIATRRTAVPYDVQQSTGTILDILHKYAEICADEFCGKCMPCRYGTQEWKLTLQKITEGLGTMGDLQKLKDINHSMKTASFCRLGLVAPFVIESVLKYHQEEIEKYITDKTPLPNTYTALPEFTINTSLCDGCPSEEKAKCQQVCTVNAITGEAGAEHVINQVKCYRCDACVPVCPKQAIAFL